MALPNIQTILEFVFALAALIFVHELGHFLICRLFKIEVEEFGFGLPPRMLTLFELGGTKYTLNWLPLGGFVRPKGESDPNVPGGLGAAKPLVRIGVYLAGPAMNILVAIALFATTLAGFGEPVPITNQVQIALMSPDPSQSPRPAELGGLKDCDIITAINDQPITNFDELRAIVDANANQPLSIAYLRGGLAGVVTVTPALNAEDGTGEIGVYMGNPVTLQPVPIFRAIPLGMTSVYNYAYQLVTLPGKIISQQIPASQGRLVGFKGMYDTYRELRSDSSTCMPWAMNITTFLAIISSSLGLLNLLPIPALDGGRILFALPELIFRRRIPPEFEAWVNAISIFILIGLLLYVNILDFIRPAQLP